MFDPVMNTANLIAMMNEIQIRLQPIPVKYRSRKQIGITTHTQSANISIKEHLADYEGKIISDVQHYHTLSCCSRLELRANTVMMTSTSATSHDTHLNVKDGRHNTSTTSHDTHLNVKDGVTIPLQGMSDIRG